MVPTLGLSANLYSSSLELTFAAKVFTFFTGLISLHSAPISEIVTDTGAKIYYNLRHGALFRPVSKETEETNDQPTQASAKPNP